jgi:drug/metabolite transporter (DMT)-like permease
VLRAGGHELRSGSPAFLTWRLIGFLLIAGGVSSVIGNVLYFEALNAGGLGITVGAVQAGSVLGGLWIGLLILRERPWREQLLGAAIIVAGLVFIAIAQTDAILESWWLGLLFGLGAGTTYALANTLSRIVQKERPLLFVALAVTSLGGLGPLTVIVALRGLAGDAIPVNAPSVAAVLVAGVANSVALAALALAVRHTEVATVNTISSASIVFSFVGAVVIFGEIGTPPMILGIVLVTVGIIVAQVRRSTARRQAAVRGAGRPAPAVAPEAGEVPEVSEVPSSRT